MFQVISTTMFCLISSFTHLQIVDKNALRQVMTDKCTKPSDSSLSSERTPYCKCFPY